MAKWHPEHSDVPVQLQDEQREVEAKIRDAFKGVQLEGGTSWLQAELDDFANASEEDYRSAGKLHANVPWEELVEDGNWEEEPGVGGFPFLDSKGFRYYIAPAMVRCVRRGYGECIGYTLERPLESYDLQNLLTSAQFAAIARFVRFMVDVHDAVNDKIYVQSWKVAYHSIWRRWDDSAPERAAQL